MPGESCDVELMVEVPSPSMSQVNHVCLFVIRNALWSNAQNVFFCFCLFLYYVRSVWRAYLMLDFSFRFQFLYARFLSWVAGYATLMTMITKENKIALIMI